MFSILAQCALLAFCYMTLVFLIAQSIKDNSIVDIAWGIGFILIAAFTFFENGLFLWHHSLVSLMVLAWGLRLSSYLLLRHSKEDIRYANWRKQWGDWVTVRSFFQIFMLQGAAMLAIAYPIILINMSTAHPPFLLAILGSIIWFVGMFFECVGDGQLAVFLCNPENKGKIMDQGLWQYTRHPNYFGEVCIWWGIFIIALGLPGGTMAIISPALITFLLLFVSGVPMTEKLFEGNAEYEEYKKRTRAFIPWLPKK